jgi:hypothetical protein
MVDQKGH